jgi:hypothetical protein
MYFDTTGPSPDRPPRESGSARVPLGCNEET